MQSVDCDQAFCDPDLALDPITSIMTGIAYILSQHENQGCI